MLSTLQEAGLSERTLVILTSDNGGFRNATSNLPLRANKGAYYEGGIRVPLLIRHPQMTTAGSTSTVPSIGMDLFPPASLQPDCSFHPTFRMELICPRCSVDPLFPSDRSSGITHTTTNTPRVFPVV
jgi:hypothetical protein